MQESNAHKPGYKHTPLGWIPGEWDVIELGQLFEFKNGINASKERYGNGMKFANVMEVINNDNLNSDMLPGTIEVDEEQVNNYIVRRGDVLFNRTSETVEEIGLSSIYLDDEPAVFGGFVIRGRPISGRLSDDYKRYCFRNQAVRRQITKGGQGAIRTNIGQTDLALVKIPVPEPIEQRSISNMLRCWDEAIQKTQQLIEQLKQRNKGLMQQLLKPKSSWGVCKLSDIFERVTRKNTEANTNVVTISAQRGFVRQDSFFNKQVASETLDNYFLVHQGEFCYNKSYSNGYDWGATKRLNDFDKAVVTTLYICFKLRGKSKHSGNFFEYFFESKLLDVGLSKIAHEGGRAHGLLNVTPHDFFSLKIAVPNMIEQVRLFNVLHTADNELKLYKQRLTTLQEQKKGLMQKLLSGELRVKYNL